MKLAEERRLGLRSMRERASAAGLPLPVYTYKAPYVVLTMYPDVAAVTADVSDNKALAELSEVERAGWAWLVARESVTTAEYQEATGVAERTARLHLKRFADLGLLRAEGATRSRRYDVVLP